MSDLEIKYIEIPIESVPAEIFEKIVEEFVEREGTDYGHSEVSFEEKKSKILAQIQKKLVRLVFSFEDESINLLTHDQWKHHSIPTCS